MGKKYQKHQIPPSISSSGSLEKQAAEEMQAGRFRKARDLYKTLCKEDRVKFLPGLIEANRSLAVQLMEKGQGPEAQQVIAYLKTIVPASELTALELEAAVIAGDWARGFQCAAGFLSQPGIRPEGRSSSLLADVLVLSFADSQSTARLPEPFKAELNVIHEALRGISESRFDQVQELIRPLPRGSIFASWKILIKALLAFYGGDSTKAKALFNQLPAGGAIERAAKAYGLFLGEPLPKSGTPLIPAACQLLGVQELAAPLRRAEEAWQKGRFVESYKELRTAPGFPSLQPTLAGALSEFYMKAGGAMSSSAFWTYVSYFDKLSFQKHFKNEDEGWLVYRMLMVEMERDPNDAPLEFVCREFIKRIPARDPLKDKIASMVLARAGTYFAQEERYFGFRRYKPELRDADKALALLEESIALDHTNLGAHLKLLDVYEAGNLKSERNRLLDKMTTLFPRSKAVMLRAGRECIARKTWIKGLDYLQRARDLDILDPEMARELVSALTKMARQHYEKGALPKGRLAFERAYQHALPGKMDFDRGSGFLKARQALLEMVFGDETIGTGLLEEARNESGSVPALLLFARSYHKELGRGLMRKDALTEKLKATPKPANAFERKSLVLMLEYLGRLATGFVFDQEIENVVKLLRPVTHKEFTQEEALDLIPLLGPMANFSGIVHGLIEAGLKRDPAHPRFRFHALSLETHGNFRGEQAELQAIRDEAVKRGDSGTIKLVTSILDSFRHGRGAQQNPDEEAFWREDDDLPSDEEIANLIPPELVAEMKKKIEAMSDAEFADFRVQSLEMMPVEFFDILFGGIHRSAGARGAKRRPINPTQPELF
jgi:tetratricopeptide (TPR) repeat protein